MKPFVPVLIVMAAVLALAAAAPSARAEESRGEATFQSLKCGMCHKADREASGPSLQAMAKLYAGKPEPLIRYLKGEAEPVKSLGKAKTMARQIEKTKALSAADLEALARYMTSVESVTEAGAP